MIKHDSFVRTCPYNEIEIGDSFSVSKQVSQADVVNFAGIVGDFNPIHVNPQYAAKTRFGRNLAHGMLTASFISTCICCGLPGNNALYLSQNLKFVKPVYIGDTVTASVEVTEKKDKHQILILKTTVENQDGEIVIEGQAAVMVMK